MTKIIIAYDNKDLRDAWALMIGRFYDTEVDKVSDGWIYGSEKDADLKMHPCIVPFEDLPAEQQAKDVLFRAVVKALMDVNEERDST